jgi:hemoglobin
VQSLLESTPLNYKPQIIRNITNANSSVGFTSIKEKYFRVYDMTLFEKYGGVPAVTSIVRSFYKEIFNKPRLKNYFLKVNSDDLIQHQIIFISHLLGKPTSEKHNTHGNLKAIHTGQQITGSDFLEVMEILKSVLISHKLESTDVEAVMSLIQGFQSAIVELPTVIRTV